MKIETVNSSNLRSVGYDKSSKTLEIEFNNGGVYQYFQVPGNIYRELMNASSHGKYFHKSMRDKYLTKRAV